MSGPWKCVPHAVYPGMLVVEGPESSITIVTSAVDIDIHSYMRRVSDAHLIAAAPELLEAIALCLVQLEAEHMPSDEVMHAMHHARAAIVKAKGGA